MIDLKRKTLALEVSIDQFNNLEPLKPIMKRSQKKVLKKKVVKQTVDENQLNYYRYIGEI